MGAALRAADATGGAARSGKRKKLQDEYEGRLRERFAVWATKHPDEAATLETQQRTAIMMAAGDLKPVQARALEKVVLTAWRQLPTHKTPIPSCDEWIAEQEAKEWIPTELQEAAS